MVFSYFLNAATVFSPALEYIMHVYIVDFVATKVQLETLDVYRPSTTTQDRLIMIFPVFQHGRLRRSYTGDVVVVVVVVVGRRRYDDVVEPGRRRRDWRHVPLLLRPGSTRGGVRLHRHRRRRHPRPPLADRPLRRRRPDLHRRLLYGRRGDRVRPHRTRRRRGEDAPLLVRRGRGYRREGRGLGKRGRRRA